MSWEQIASGGLLDAKDIEKYEVYIGEGQRALLELDLRAPAPDYIVAELQSQLQKASVREVQVTTGSPLLHISWRKGFPFLPVVVGIILGLIVLAVLIIGWRLFREVIAIIPEPFQGLAVGGVILVLVVVAMLVWQRRRQWR